MSRRKKAQEELMRTHVLNLNEIRAAEANDKRERRRKIPAVFFVIGFILIIVGLSISSLVAYRNSHKTKQVKIIKNKDKLTCISNLKDNYYLVDIHTETVYNFKNKKLYSSKSISSSKPYGEINYILILQNDIHINSYEVDSYNDSNIMYKLRIVSSNELQLDSQINYDNLVMSAKQNVINMYTRVPSFNNKYTYEQVKKESEKLGALCN